MSKKKGKNNWLDRLLKCISLLEQNQLLDEKILGRNVQKSTDFYKLKCAKN